MKLIGIDYGRARIGMAVTDESATSVRGLNTLHKRENSDIINNVCDVIAGHGVQAVAIGLPLGGEGQDTPMSREVRRFAEKIRERSGCEVHFIEESFTSRQAQQIMQSRPRKKRRDKGALDRIAACLILEQYLREKG